MHSFARLRHFHPRRQFSTVPSLATRDARSILYSYGRNDVLIKNGQGAILTDTNGKQYIDFSSGICVTSLGHSHPKITQQIIKQANSVIHTSNLYYTEPQVELAEKLLKLSSFDRVFFCNSGTEANEAALKFSRRYAGRKYNNNSNSNGNTTTNPNTNSSTTSKVQFVAFSGCFHGRTVGALSLTYKRAYKDQFAPLMPAVTHIPFNDEAALRQNINSDTAAVFVEPIQGEGGVNPATQTFMRAIRDECDRVDALMVVDEIQCGLGRTGSLWAHTLYGVQPDIMTLAKPLANGLPIGAVLVKQKVADAIEPGDHGSTFAGSPLACSVGSVVLDIISEPTFLKESSKAANHLMNGLKSLQNALSSSTDHVQITALRALPSSSSASSSPSSSSFLIGVDLSIGVGGVIGFASELGLLLISAGPNTLRLAPPLIITIDEIDRALDILKQVLTCKQRIQKADQDAKNHKNEQEKIARQHHPKLSGSA